MPIVATITAPIIILILCEKRVKFNILKADANLAVGAVWANHSYCTKRVVLGGLNELKDFVVS